MLKSPFKLLPLALALFASACLDNKLEPMDDVAGSSGFLAQQRDFAPYKDWMTFENDITTDHSGVIGTTTVYLNQLPEDGQLKVGTITVKITKSTTSDDVTVHAMAKRGTGFNTQGAAGWEYFELLLSKTGEPYILWRGAKPPSGEMYQQLPGAKMASATEGNCNDCHADGKDGMLGDDLVNLFN